MPHRGKSPAARYIDQLELIVQRGVPLPPGRFSPQHILAGAGSGLLLGFWFSLMALQQAGWHWGWLLAGTLLGALLFPLAGRPVWNWLHQRYTTPLRELARHNLQDGELLLLCMSEELPARYERLRHAAQSYGKTREATWAELRRGSMRDRLNWLAKNYATLCGLLNRPWTLGALSGFRLAMTLLALAPLIALLGWIGLIIWQPPPTELSTQVVLWLIAALLVSSLGCGALASMASSIERLALYAELVELLDTDLAMQAQLAAAEEDS